MTLKELGLEFIVRGATKAIRRPGEYVDSRMDWRLIGQIITDTVNKEIESGYEAKTVWGRDGLELRIYKL